MNTSPFRLFLFVRKSNFGAEAERLSSSFFCGRFESANILNISLIKVVWYTKFDYKLSCSREIIIIRDSAIII